MKQRSQPGWKKKKKKKKKIKRKVGFNQLHRSYDNLHFSLFYLFCLD